MLKCWSVAGVTTKCDKNEMKPDVFVVLWLQTNPRMSLCKCTQDWFSVLDIQAENSEVTTCLKLITVQYFIYTMRKAEAFSVHTDTGLYTVVGDILYPAAFVIKLQKSDLCK